MSERKIGTTKIQLTQKNLRKAYLPTVSFSAFSSSISAFVYYTHTPSHLYLYYTHTNTHIRAQAYTDFAAKFKMDSLSASVAPPIVFLAGNHHHRRRISFIPGAISSHSDRRFQCLSKHRIRRRVEVWCKLSNQGDVDREKDEDKNDDEEVKKALELDGTIPSTSDEFVKQVSSRAYDMRRHLQQSFDSSSYDGSYTYSYSLFGCDYCS